MDKYEFNVKIEAPTKDEAKEKLVNLLAFAKKLTANEINDLRITIEEKPEIIKFIREVITEFNVKELSLIDVISIAKKAYTRFKN